MKTKILCTSDWADTGFGRVMKSILPRLVETGKYEIMMVGWVYQGNYQEYEEARKLGVQLNPTRFWAVEDRYGQQTIPKLMKQFKPHLLFSLGDVWMCDWIMDSEIRELIKWVFYTPIDRDCLSQTWLPILKNPDCLVLYSDFAKDVVKRHLPFVDPMVIYHGVDTEVFYPRDDKATLRNDLKIDEDAFIIGQCCRNQSRKLIGRTIKVFKAWNCETCFENRDHCENMYFRCDLCDKFKQIKEKEKAILYLHMTDGTGRVPGDGIGVSWNIFELAYRFKLKQRVMLSPHLTVKKGYPDFVLNKVFNIFDVHLLTTKREGFGLPILETMSAGIPNIATGYSACTELLKGGGGLPIKVETFVNEPDVEAEGAICSIPDAVDQIEKLFTDEELRKNIAKQSRKFAEETTWDATINKWCGIFDSLV